jgi:hypothetical protein
VAERENYSAKVDEVGVIGVRLGVLPFIGPFADVVPPTTFAFGVFFMFILGVLGGLTIWGLR